MTDLTWRNDTRKLGDLVPQPDNPRKIKSAQAERLKESFDDFAQVETIAIGPDGAIYNGHQRLDIWAQEYGPDLEVDVRVSSRPLSRREWQRLTVLLHEGATGEWDFDLLAGWEGVDTGDLLEWGFDEAALGIVVPEDYSDFDAELDALAGMEDINVVITVPEKHRGEVKEWLANGEAQTAPGMGKGVLRRCGLL